MIIYVLDDGETWTLSEPTAVAITDEQLPRIEGGEKFYHVVPDWDEQQNDDDEGLTLSEYKKEQAEVLGMILRSNADPLK